MCKPFLHIDPPVAVMGSYISRQIEPAARFAQYEFEERYALMRQRQQIDLVATYAAAYDRETFLQSGGFDTSFPKANNEDVEFSYRLSKEGKRMVFMPEAIVAHPHVPTWSDYFRTKVKRAYWRTQVYRRYPEKAVVDSYTPQILKVQILFSLPALLGIVLASITGMWYWLLSLLLFWGAAMPTAIFMIKRNPSFFLWAFWGIWLRSLAFTSGVAWGILRPHTFLNTETTVTALTPHQ
jgi:GT2 family glycosyltransferase